MLQVEQFYKYDSLDCKLNCIHDGNTNLRTTAVKNNVLWNARDLVVLQKVEKWSAIHIRNRINTKI